jgi:hypothetical protein
MRYTKRQTVIVGSILLSLVMCPIVQNWTKKPVDSFPLSYYPMFSKKRGETYGLYYVMAYDSLGTKKRLPYHIAGTGGFNQVRRQINKAHKIDGGRPFLKKVGKRLAKKDKSLYERLVKIELVKGYYHLENYFLRNDTLPLLERKIASYQIEKR